MDIVGCRCGWRDVFLLGLHLDVPLDWFSEGLIKKVGNGKSTTFWFDPWVDISSLRTRFPVMYQRWLLTNMMLLLSDPQPATIEDVWLWRHDSSGVFSIKSAYSLVEEKARFERNIRDVGVTNLARMWASWATSKVIIFSWQLLKDRVPSRQNLLKHRVLVGSSEPKPQSQMEGTSYSNADCDEVSGSVTPSQKQELLKFELQSLNTNLPMMVIIALWLL
ncbi:cysteine-rich receptor-like protein kinase [Trifolium pratense]|uniref:Cysteine-rich receptor-like protein kinase n=1 Tax=Trifolium pratense TaxID=57577 RepID=A0A2K3LC68_TRIPR|nr:cysteine-rich receptor-like protein kinase [Trifolium pratense]